MSELQLSFILPIVLTMIGFTAFSLALTAKFRKEGKVPKPFRKPEVRHLLMPRAEIRPDSTIKPQMKKEIAHNV